MQCPDALSRVKVALRERVQQQKAQTESSTSVPPSQIAFACSAILSVSVPPDELCRTIEGYKTDRHLSAVQARLHKVVPKPDHEGRRKIHHLPFEEDVSGTLFFYEPSGGLRLYVPRSIVREVLETAHDAEAHIGAHRMLHKVGHTYYWRNIRTDVIEYIRFCPGCLQNSTLQHPPFGDMQPIDSPPEPFHTITIDLVTDLPECLKFNHGSHLFDTTLFVTCKFTKMVRPIAGRKDFKATHWARLLFENSDWGIPSVIISDRDGRFTSRFWRALVSIYLGKCHFTTAYHPQADGQSEHSIQTIVIALRHFVNQYQKDWPNALPFVEQAMNSSVNASTGKAQFELLMGFNPQHAVDLKAKFALSING